MSNRCRHHRIVWVSIDIYPKTCSTTFKCPSNRRVGHIHSGRIICSFNWFVRVQWTSGNTEQNEYLKFGWKIILKAKQIRWKCKIKDSSKFLKKHEWDQGHFTAKNLPINLLSEVHQRTFKNVLRNESAALNYIAPMLINKFVLHIVLHIKEKGLSEIR
jgi:hypothetical protein